MARPIHKLPAKSVDRLDTGLHCDGGGLYLEVAAGGSRSWIFRFRDGTRTRDMGLGGAHTVTLAEAREKARMCRAQRMNGIDPIERRDQERTALELEKVKNITFEECAREYFKQRNAGWKNDRHRGQWMSTMETYVFPTIGRLPVQSVDTALVLRILNQSKDGVPFWNGANETARRVRGRIEAVIDYATPQYRTGDNGARWTIIKSKFAERTTAKKRMPALPYSRMSEFMADLRARDGITPRALEFCILTVTRSAAACGALWSEIDFAEKIWIIPAERNKGKLSKPRKLRVALSDRATVLLMDLQQTRTSEFIFPGYKGKSVTECAIREFIQRMSAAAEQDGRVGYIDPDQDNRIAVPHGFRSSFKTWASETTSFANDVSEAALGHTNGDEVERSHGGAYGRGDLFEKRKKLMEAWARYCSAPAISGNVVGIRA